MPDAGSSPLLEVTGLSTSFRVPRSASGSTRLQALSGVDLRLGRGETLGLVGESGCGKSTLARVLLMLERPDSGTVRFAGVDPFALRGKVSCQKRICTGTLKAARCSATWARNSCSVASAPGLRVTTATGSSPSVRCDTPTTAASITAGWS